MSERTRDERVDEYYDESAWCLANWLVDAEDEMEKLSDELHKVNMAVGEYAAENTELEAVNVRLRAQVALTRDWISAVNDGDAEPDPDDLAAKLDGVEWTGAW
jgi:hypothetical protein